MAILDQNFAWHFATLEGGSDQGPHNAAFEYFKDMYESLVREAIQNSLDASDRSGNPVKVTFNFRQIPISNFSNFFEIGKHIQACLDTYNTSDGKERFEPMLDYLKRAKKEGFMHYLEVSDENTTGMTYSFNSNNNKEGGKFYAFMKAVGVDEQQGSETSGGAFGFGKSAFYKVSAINTLLVSTKTITGDTFFEGGSRLCTHYINKEKHVDTGFFCMKDDNKERPIETGIPPRFTRTEVGSTICVMGLDYKHISKEKAIEQIKTAVLFNFWMAIQDKHLEVIIKDGNTQNAEINHDNLEKWMEDKYPATIDGTTVHNNPRPYFEAVKHADEDKKHILEKKTLPILGDVRFYLIKSPKAPADRYIFMRKELMYINKTNVGSQKGFYGVFIVDG